MITKLVKVCNMAFISIVSLFFFSSCEAIRIPTAGRVKISIQVLDSARTILPKLLVSDYLIDFLGPEPVESLVTSSSSVNVDLATGDWDITVHGRNDAGKPVALGAQTAVKVRSLLTTLVSIRLSAINNGKGDIDVVLSWPSMVTPAVEQVLVELDGIAVDASGVALDKAACTARVKSSVEAGNHKLQIELRYGPGRLFYNEAVQVSGNLISSSTIVLGIGDFSSVPASPSNLGVKEGHGAILIDWTDNSKIEDGFIVERSVDGGSWQALGGALEANTIGYTDSTAVAGATYSYRVKAYNGMGESPASDPASGSWESPTAGTAISFGAVTRSSMSLSWGTASDNVSPTADLEYYLARSTSDNIRTSEDALANGSAVMEWSKAKTAAVVAGLDPGAVYYFCVLIRDAAGNIGAGSPVSCATLDATGGIGIGIVLVSPTDEPITFSQADAPVIGRAGTLLIGVNQAFDGYEWVLDSAVLAGQTARSLSLPCATLGYGVHQLAVFVTKNGLLYSARFRFIVGN
jgi:hypothetical protein